jgi:hypothetical protein
MRLCATHGRRRSHGVRLSACCAPFALTPSARRAQIGIGASRLAGLYAQPMPQIATVPSSGATRKTLVGRLGILSRRPSKKAEPAARANVAAAAIEALEAARASSRACATICAASRGAARGLASSMLRVLSDPAVPLPSQAAATGALLPLLAAASLVQQADAAERGARAEVAQFWWQYACVEADGLGQLAPAAASDSPSLVLSVCARAAELRARKLLAATLLQRLFPDVRREEIEAAATQVSGTHPSDQGVLDALWSICNAHANTNASPLAIVFDGDFSKSSVHLYDAPSAKANLLLLLFETPASTMGHALSLRTTTTTTTTTTTAPTSPTPTTPTSQQSELTVTTAATAPTTARSQTSALKRVATRLRSIQALRSMRFEPLPRRQQSYRRSIALPSQLQEVTSPRAELRKGTRVFHPDHGAGTVVEADERDESWRTLADWRSENRHCLPQDPSALSVDALLRYIRMQYVEIVCFLPADLLGSIDDQLAIQPPPAAIQHNALQHAAPQGNMPISQVQSTPG